MIFLLTGVAAAATVAFRGVTPRTAMLAGCLVLLAGLAVTFATAAAAAFLAGAAVAGAGFGLALLGVNRTLIALAAPGQRAGLIAAIFIISFLGLSVPVVIAGVATAHFGLHRTALAYCVAIAALVAVAAGSLMLRRRASPPVRAPASPALVRQRPSRAKDPGCGRAERARHDARHLPGRPGWIPGGEYGRTGDPGAFELRGPAMPFRPSQTAVRESPQGRRARIPSQRPTV
jgi:MFS family permease